MFPSKTLRIFISSTSMDLAQVRSRMQQAVLRLQHLPIGMETFIAQPGMPADECCRKAAEADVVIVVVAHRYGFVPGPEAGGDGERSITWLEVDAARRAGKAVLAFLLHPQAAWNHPREQDRLLTEPERAAEIISNVRRLQEFRAFLEAHFTCSTFSGEDDLETKITAAIATLHGSQASLSPPTPVWQPFVVHPLQPARHFHGRDALVDDIITWARAPVAEQRIFSIVAAGGTGKTALVEHVLSRLGTDVPAGLLVWSFYEDPKTEEFLRVACHYFTGGADSPVGARLERLQQTLSGPTPHLLVLDGLERVQAEGTGGQPRGSLEDPQLKRLLRFVASSAGQARALITTRFPVVDLHDWEGARCRVECLDDLDEQSARAVLRKWGVQGEDATLDQLIRPLHGHALSIAVLGSYLGNFRNGDPARAPAFKPRDAGARDPKAAKLSRILAEYARVLGRVERDLLATVANFPRGAQLEMLQHLAGSGRRISGELSGVTESHLAEMLERLRHLGLLFAYGEGLKRSYSAHPFLREYFQQLLTVPAVRIHAALLSRLSVSPSLLGRPHQSLPTEDWELDQYESLIEHTRLAGRVEQAFDIYWDQLGSFTHLGKCLGENPRGLRIVSGFANNGEAEMISRALPREKRSLLATAWGLFAEYLGDLSTARRCFDVSVHSTRDSNARAVVLLNQCEAAMLSGELPLAREAAEAAQRLTASSFFFSDQRADSHAYLAVVLGALGDLEGAKTQFSLAKEFYPRGLNSICGVWEAEFLARCGDLSTAYARTLKNRKFCEGHRHWRDVSYCDVLLARLLARTNTAEARLHLDTARAFAARSGEVEILLRAYLAAAEVAQHVGDVAAAKVEAEAGILLADGCGFGLQAIELRLALALVHLDMEDGVAALRLGNEALVRSLASDCQFAWGEAEALYVLGAAEALLGNRELARHHLTAAVVAQTRLSHPALTSTRLVLSELGVSSLPLTGGNGR